MSTFVRDNTPIVGDPISGENVRRNHEGLRKWLNTGIRQSDLASGIVDWTHILAGEYASVTPDHRFTSGNHYSAFVDAEPAHQGAIGMSMKPTAQGTSTGVLYVPLIGKRIRVNVDDGMILISAYLQVASQLNFVNAGTQGLSDLAYLFIDGLLQAGKYIYFHAQDTTTPAIDGGGTSWPRVGTLYHLKGGLAKGLHDVEIRINPNHDLSLVYARSLSVECLEL